MGVIKGMHELDERFGAKIAIIGAGLVGSTCAYAIMMGGLASQIILVDVDKKRAEGEAMDLIHGESFVKPVDIVAGDYAECAGARIVIIAAGAAQRPGETRLDLVKKNTAIFRDIVPKIVRHAPDAILIVVTNPVDILTYVALKISELPLSHVIGSGTVLDTSRFRHLLSEHCQIDVRNVHGYIMGEHGDSEVPAWSLTNIAGVRIDEYCVVCKRGCGEDIKERIFSQTRDVAYEIIERKGATYYAVGLAVRRIVESILRNEKSVLTVSSFMNGFYGIGGVCMSLPTVVDAGGVNRVLELPLEPGEEEALQTSASVLLNIVKEIGL
jgi:L-lactate dehydrogenase